jgi:signal transduction histidine kinase
MVPLGVTGRTSGAAATPASATAAIEARWRHFARWGPYTLLGGGALLSAGTAAALMTPAERYAAVPLGLAALALESWWSRTSGGRPELSLAGQRYYAVRTVLAFALTWLNPFFALYAALGYVDVTLRLPARWIRMGLLASAVTIAGSQSGGLPPRSEGQWVVFATLFAIHAGLLMTFTRIAGQEAELAKANKAAIAELERANARLEQALQENAGLQARLVAQAREAGVADERRRLAAEIHDTLAQGLIGIVTQLQASLDQADPAAARRHTERAADLARESLGEARRSVQDLGPGALAHATLPEALRQLTTSFAAETGVTASFTVTGTAEPLHKEIEATLLRIGQEALANAGRHARAGRVGVTLSFIDDEVTLDVRDDGRGFAPDAPTPGFGLGGMRARAVRLAGTVDIESEPGGGTAVSARVPLVRHG